MSRWCLFYLAIFYAISADAVKIDLVKVDKSDRVLYLISGNDIVKRYQIALGKNPKGHKKIEGDQKTPEGNYVLDYKKEDSSFYRSMHINYPNEDDIRNAKKLGADPGGLIMVHGQPNKLGFISSILQKFNWTNGCIALTNKDMDEFMSLVNVGTRIQITW